MKSAQIILSAILLLFLVGCVPSTEISHPPLHSLNRPGTRGTQLEFLSNAYRSDVTLDEQGNDSVRARLQFVKDYPPEERLPMAGDRVTNMPSNSAMALPLNGPANPSEPTYEVFRSTNPNVRPYSGPLHVGEPGASASLWRSSGPESRLFRDHRAFQAMDLITIVVAEDAEGKKEADTATKKDSSLLMGIANLFNFENDIVAKNPGIDTSSIVSTNVENEFTGEGETTRKGTLRARIAAMVVEVFPNGVLRIEGEKVIAVNNEEQVMIISGLVRPRDVTSENEVMSTKVANLRVDYFGKGVVGEVQSAGWLGRFLSSLWPF
ncbi:MAG: flagellar basal body L-ring protein FlgH [Bdellovibrionales bacterium]|nr:flagellar basal body L-ring protein FlgH [Bdellovibrionales bacterium]